MAEPLLLDIPFGDAPGSPVALDYGPQGYNASIVDGDFEIGRNHRAAYFPNNGYAEIQANVVPLTGTYTLMAWVKADSTATGPSSSWLLINFAGLDEPLYLGLDSALTYWTYLVFQQDTDRFRAFVNGRLAGVTLFPGGQKPIGWALVNDNTQVFSGHGRIEDLLLFGGIVDDTLPTDPTDPTDPNSPPTFMTNNYYINGVNFKDYGVIVTKSKGLLDNYDLKEPFTMDWGDYHGLAMDTSKLRYKANDITLNCLLYGNRQTDTNDFIDKVMAFKNLFAHKQGLQRLMRQVDDRVFVYEVLLMQAVDFDFDYPDRSVTFSLNFREPEPVKRVLKFSGSGQVSLNLSSAKVLNVYWGDGTHDFDVRTSISHTYSSGGDHYIIVTGVISEITSFSSNASTVWNIF